MSREPLLPPRYEGASLIARGGMGEVYRATDTTLGRDVAVKVLSDWYAADEEVRARFTREALAAARLSSEPNTVTIFDVGEWEGRPFIVMAYVPGGSLADRVRGPVEPATALAWLDETARALDAAHRNGVVHRDVKPANLLLDADDTVRVADFGIASATGLDSLTHTGTVLGTAGYLAPEQAAGSRATPASDRYALGVVAFELLTGSRPFAAESTTAEALGHAHADVPSASERNPQLPRAVDGVFAQALAKDPESRYSSGDEFVAALRAALADAPATTRVMPAVAASHRRARTLPLVAGGAAALGLAGLVLAATLGDGTDPAATPTVVKTVVTTAPSVTEQVTVTADPPPPPPPTAPSGAELNDQAFALLQQGRYDEALPLAEQAFAKLQGSGELVEAYAAYNYAWALAGVGRCEEALPLLDHSEAIQGKRKEISKLRKDCRKERD